MAQRANWKGSLKIAELGCAVALYTAASTAERISLHSINRVTGNRTRREYIDAETGKPVAREDQVKGYELSDGDYILLDPEEISAAVPVPDKVLDIEAFIPCTEVDETYFDQPYYLAPAGPADHEVFGLIRDGLAAAKVVALARTVLFRRMRTLVIRPLDDGLVATTLNFDYEVRPAETAFKSIPAVKVEAEMLDLARHIIRTKTGRFDPSAFDDRYEDALAELVKAKLAGRKIKPRRDKKTAQPVDLLQALRESAQLDRTEKSPQPRGSRSPKRKAG